LEDFADRATFLFTDIEGSTRLWEEEPERMREAMARHDALAREAVVEHGGQVVKMTGDGLHAVFGDAVDALHASVRLQAGLAELERACGIPIRARCGMHAGAFERRDGDYFGTAVNRAARIMSAAHGGQVLLSQAVGDLVGRRLPEGIGLRDLGTARLRDLARAERLYQVVAPLLRTDFPPLRSLEGTPNNLPNSLSSFVGRARELSEVRALLRDTRLLTVTGMGGIGKTRLALHAAAEEMDGYPDGVWLVELASLHDARRVAQSAASAMGVKEEPGRPVLEALERHVRGRRMLLVLDNCEHLLETSAELAHKLLSAGAGLRILATSREPLRVAGEVAYGIGGMGLPPSDDSAGPAIAASEAVGLFLDRASAARPGFAITAKTAPAVAAICRAVDGIPLALELAAARVRSMPVEDIAARVLEGTQLLASRDPTALPRQRTVRALIDWSHDLLSEGERAVFRQASVFESGFTIEAVEAVCGGRPQDTVIDVVGQLVEKSLLVREEGAGRYRMLETVRQYALERLDASPEREEVRRRHFGFYLSLAEHARTHVTGPERGHWLSILDAERENVLAAHAWSQRAAVEPESVLRLASGMKQYWISRGLLELGQRVTQQALDRAGTAAPDEARCRALFDAGQLRYFAGRYDEARRFLEPSLDIARSLGSPQKICRILQPLGMAALGEGDREMARRCLTEALDIARSCDDPRDVATAANALGQLYRLEASLDDAAALFEEKLRISRELGDREMVAVTLLNMAMVSADRDGGAYARGAVAEALEAAQQLGSQALVKSVLEVTAGLAAAARDDASAARFHGAAEAQARKTGLRQDPADAAFLGPLMAAARERTGAGLFARLESEGGAVASSQVISEARAWLLRASGRSAIDR